MNEPAKKKENDERKKVGEHTQTHTYLQVNFDGTRRRKDWATIIQVTEIVASRVTVVFVERVTAVALH